MTGAHQLHQDIENTSRRIAAFRDHATAGKAIDLSGLEDRIASICAEINNLDAPQGRELKAPLLSLMEEMNRLVETLQTEKDSIVCDMQGITARQKAVSAYGTGAAAGLDDEESRD